MKAARTLIVSAYVALVISLAIMAPRRPDAPKGPVHPAQASTRGR